MSNVQHDHAACDPVTEWEVNPVVGKPRVKGWCFECRESFRVMLNE